jgi:hypothetical protein
VRGLERAQDALGAGQALERGQRVGVGARHVAGAPAVLPVGVLGADARIVEAGRDRVRLGDLADLRALAVREHVRLRAVQDADAAGAERGGVARGLDAVARRLDTDEVHALVGDERREQPGGVGATADARDQRVGQPALGGEHLGARLAADHRLQLAHHPRVRVRAGDRADQVERVADVGHPVAHRLVHRVLECPGTGRHRDDAGAEQAHAEDVELLARDVLGAHVDLARHAEQRRDRRGGDAVLAGPRLGDEAALAHAPRQQRLADAVVDLVRAGVVEVLALQVQVHAERVAQVGRAVQE